MSLCLYNIVNNYTWPKGRRMCLAQFLPVQLAKAGQSKRGDAWVQYCVSRYRDSEGTFRIVYIETTAFLFMVR